jgi:hypothetical protein
MSLGVGRGYFKKRMRNGGGGFERKWKKKRKTGRNRLKWIEIKDKRVP